LEKVNDYSGGVYCIGTYFEANLYFNQIFLFSCLWITISRF